MGCGERMRAAVAGAGFEGVITMKAVSGDEVTVQRYSLKGDRLRIDDIGFTADGGATILDGKNREGFVVDPDEQVYVPLRWNARTPEEAKQDAMDLAVTGTGKRGTVAGQACDIVVERDTGDGSTSELCLAAGLGNAALAGLAGISVPPWLLDLGKEHGFPLRGIDRDPSGRELSRFEATKIERRPLDDRLFAPPAGFRRMNMEEVGLGRDTP